MVPARLEKYERNSQCWRKFRFWTMKNTSLLEANFEEKFK